MQRRRPGCLSAAGRETERESSKMEGPRVEQFEYLPEEGEEGGGEERQRSDAATTLAAGIFFR